MSSLVKEEEEEDGVIIWKCESGQTLTDGATSMTKLTMTKLKQFLHEKEKENVE